MFEGLQNIVNRTEANQRENESNTPESATEVQEDSSQEQEDLDKQVTQEQRPNGVTGVCGALDIPETQEAQGDIGATEELGSWNTDDENYN